jgi:hypothetical protein
LQRRIPQASDNRVRDLIQNFAIELIIATPPKEQDHRFISTDRTRDNEVVRFEVRAACVQYDRGHRFRYCGTTLDTVTPFKLRKRAGIHHDHRHGTVRLKLFENVFNTRVEATKYSFDYLIGGIRSDGGRTHRRFIGIPLLGHQSRTQRPTGIRGVYLSKLLRGSLGNDASTARSAFGPKVNDVICARDHFDVVLHDDDAASSLD